jgi:1-acyl-sn-glycerol-3-phosphate acyltransferase
MKMRPLYMFLKVYAPICLRIYFRKIRVIGRENVPLKGAVIFASNHQNAFMDPVLIACETFQKPWFLTRASIFNSSISKLLWTSLAMVPIYRIRDGVNSVKKNEEVIEDSNKLLGNQGSLVMFVEGNHDMRWSLRPLKKGVARMAFAAEENAGFTLGLKIVPTGLQYEDHQRFRSELLVSFGKPILVNNYRQVYENNPKEAYVQLIRDLHESMGKLIVNIQPIEEHDTVKAILKSRQPREHDLTKRLEKDQEIVRQFREDMTNGKTLDVKADPAQLKELTQARADKHHAEMADPGSGTTQKLGKYLLAILGFPVFIFGLVNSILPYLLIKWIIRKFVKDYHWIASMKFAGMILVAPVFYLVQAIILYSLIPRWDVVLLYLILLPVSTVITYEYRRYFRILQKKEPA